MPTSKQQILHCPFCAMTSTRGTGLSAHVRAQHPSRYKRWKRNPNRLIEAGEAATAPNNKEPKTIRRVPAAPTPTKHSVRHVEPVQGSQQPPASAAAQSKPDGGANAPLALLKQVHEQLTQRKDAIEKEMTRIEALKKEHEGVVSQLAAIDQAMSAFQNVG